MTIFKQNHMTDLSIMISFTSFQAYYANVGPAAVEKTSGVDIMFFTYLSNISYSGRNHLINEVIYLSDVVFRKVHQI